MYFSKNQTEIVTAISLFEQWRKRSLRMNLSISERKKSLRWSFQSKGIPKFVPRSPNLRLPIKKEHGSQFQNEQLHTFNTSINGPCQLASRRYSQLADLMSQLLPVDSKLKHGNIFIGGPGFLVLLKPGLLCPIRILVLLRQMQLRVEFDPPLTSDGYHVSTCSSDRITTDTLCVPSLGLTNMSSINSNRLSLI